MLCRRFLPETRSVLQIALLLLILCVLLLEGCSAQSLHSFPVEKRAGVPFQFSDDLNRTVSLEHKPRRVVALSASFAETWLLSGGTLVGTTSDSQNREAFPLAESVLTIGTIKDPNSEAILALEPDFILLSTEIPSHLALSPLLTKCKIPHAYFHVETMEDYLKMLQKCTTLTGRSDLYRTNGLDMLSAITQELITHRHEKGNRDATFLLLRSYSTKVKAKGGDNMVSRMLEEFGYTNLSELYPSLLEELSMETIVCEDPTFIFVIPMGDERAAKATMTHLSENNPAFSSLGAVQNGRYHLLPKALFHYKPNNRWVESYAYLATLLTQ